MALLKEFSISMIDNFSKDFFLLVNIVKNLDEIYGDANQLFAEDMKRFRKLLLLWNKKYALLFVKHYEDGMQFRLKMTIKEKSILDVAAQAIKIEGLESINGKKVMIGKENIEKYLAPNTKRVNLSYQAEDENDENTLTFELEKNDIVLIYSKKDMLDKNSPEFQICCYYALKNYDDKVDLQKMANFFSFNTNFEEQEGKGIGYLDRVRLFDKT